jgi:hypothetical protein
MIRSGQFSISSIYSLAGLITLLCTTCLDPFPLPDVSGGLLVVEATFTNEAESNRVLLSFAGQVNQGGEPVSGAGVSISDDQGNTGAFRESEKGQYLPADEDFIGIPGREYVLHIVLSNGREYRSAPCLFRDVPPIEQLRWDLQEQPSPDNTAMMKGIEFYLDTHDPDNRVRHYLWKYEETWQSNIPYPITDIYLGNGEFQEVNHSTWCFLQSRSSEIMLESTRDLSESRIQDKSLIFVSNETSRLSVQYRIRVQQFGLSEEAYFYLEKLKEITGQNGSIFDVQPFSLRSNIRSISHPDEIVMGYFLVSGVSVKTMTVGRYQLPPEYQARNPEQIACWQQARTANISTNPNIDWTIRRMEARTDLVFVGRIWESNIETGEDELVGLQFAPEECTTCEGINEKPEDWF